MSNPPKRKLQKEANKKAKEYVRKWYHSKDDKSTRTCRAVL